MVRLCKDKYTNEEYDQYFQSYSFSLSDFQKYAIEGIIKEQHVLVTAHTGSGKTLPAEFAIRHFFEKGKKLIYTSPIKALSNQKYYDFCNKFPDISFGLFTGDIKTNPEADVLIMTTEILMNYLFVQNNEGVGSTDFNINIENELGCVVFDEVHYINDADRGQVWEKTILMLPKHIQMIMLSATIDNPEKFAKWCEKSGEKEVYLCNTSHRVVPLYHYGYFTTIEHTFKVIKDKQTKEKIRKNSNKLIPLQSEKNVFNDENYKLLYQLDQLHKNNGVRMKTSHVLNNLIKMLRDEEKLPAICFVFSRKKVESFAQMITIPLLGEEDEHINMERECEHIVRRLPNYKEYLELPEYINLIYLLQKGIGIHHSGMIPILREIVELMITKKRIKLLFATESFAIGLDCPIKTAIFSDLNKYDGHQLRYLHAHEYTQMAGRAGRRGLDKIGYVVHCNNCFSYPFVHEYKNIMNGKPQQLVSKYQISYSLIFNLLKHGTETEFEKFSEKSMMQNEIEGNIISKENAITDVENKIIELKEIVNTNSTPHDVCEKYMSYKDEIKYFKNKKRKQAENEMREIEENHKNLKKHINDLDILNDYEIHLCNIKEDLYYTRNYIKQQTCMICDVMKKKHFIENVNVNEDLKDYEYTENISYRLTNLGHQASFIAEIHPMILIEIMQEWDNFSIFTTTQLVGLLSCFTDIRVPEDDKIVIVNCKDNLLNNKIKELSDRYLSYMDEEVKNEMYTDYKYEDALQYDLINIAIDWCLCEDEESCKYLIENKLRPKEISVGDFNKALLKIVTISKEFMKVFEYTQNMDALQKFGLIEKYLLKYVATNQSLYV